MGALTSVRPWLPTVNGFDCAYEEVRGVAITIEPWPISLGMTVLSMYQKAFRFV